METLSCFPCGISGFVFSCNPSLTGCVQKILSAEDVHRKEQLRVLDAAVNMAFGCKIHNIVDVVLGKQFVGELSVSYVAAYEEATLVVDVVLYGAEVSCVSQKIEYNNLYILVFVFFVKQVLDEVCTNESCGSCYKISLHVIYVFNDFAFYVRVSRTITTGILCSKRLFLSICLCQ